MRLKYAETPDYYYMIGLFESCIEDNIKDNIKFVRGKNDPSDDDGFHKIDEEHEAAGKEKRYRKKSKWQEKE